MHEQDAAQANNQTYSAADVSYDQQLLNKVRSVSKLLEDFTPPPYSVYRSAGLAYRMRAEFRVWHDGDDLNYVMFTKGNARDPQKILDFPPASKTIQHFMPLLLSAVRERTILRQKLFQVDFLTTQNNECLISLLYHRKLDDDWLIDAKKLQAELGVKIIGRARKQKLVASVDHVIEQYELPDAQLSYMQIENSFTQPNAEINQQMLNWAHTNTQNAEGDLLELYCGNGNFSIALAAHFDRVLATEMDKNGIRAARHNISVNSITNLELVRMSAAEVASALSGERLFRRMKHIEIDDYNFTTVLVDPPRAGLDKDALAFIERFERIIYISCNPKSLAENLRQLTSTHTIVRAAIFDQFPHTEHVESAVILQRV